MEIEHILLIPMAIMLVLISFIPFSFLFYTDVEYSGYIDNITFSGGGFGSPDMINIYFDDGRIISTQNTGNLKLRQDCNATITIRDYWLLNDDLIDIKNLEDR